MRGATIYVVLGHGGEFDRTTWIAGVFSDLEQADTFVRRCRLWRKAEMAAWEALMRRYPADFTARHKAWTTRAHARCPDSMRQDESATFLSWEIHPSTLE